MRIRKRLKVKEICDKYGRTNISKETYQALLQLEHSNTELLENIIKNIFSQAPCEKLFMELHAIARILHECMFYGYPNIRRIAKKIYCWYFGPSTSSGIIPITKWKNGEKYNPDIPRYRSITGVLACDIQVDFLFYDDNGVIRKDAVKKFSDMTGANIDKINEINKVRITIGFSKLNKEEIEKKISEKISEETIINQLNNEDILERVRFFCKLTRYPIKHILIDTFDLCEIREIYDYL